MIELLSAPCRHSMSERGLKGMISLGCDASQSSSLLILPLTMSVDSPFTQQKNHNTAPLGQFAPLAEGNS